MEIHCVYKRGAAYRYPTRFDGLSRLPLHLPLGKGERIRLLTPFVIIGGAGGELSRFICLAECVNLTG